MFDRMVFNHTVFLCKFLNDFINKRDLHLIKNQKFIQVTYFLKNNTLAAAFA